MIVVAMVIPPKLLFPSFQSFKEKRGKKKGKNSNGDGYASFVALWSFCEEEEAEKL